MQQNAVHVRISYCIIVCEYSLSLSDSVCIILWAVCSCWASFVPVYSIFFVAFLSFSSRKHALHYIN